MEGVQIACSKTVANQDEGCPVLGMGEIGRTGSVIARRSCDVDIGIAQSLRCILDGKFAVDQILLDGLQRLNFRHPNRNVFVKLLHDQGSTDIVDVPQRSKAAYSRSPVGAYNNLLATA